MKLITPTNKEYRERENQPEKVIERVTTIPTVSSKRTRKKSELVLPPEPFTINDLAEMNQTTLTRVTLHWRLKDLLKSGKIRISGKRQGAKGKPATVYSAVN